MQTKKEHNPEMVNVIAPPICYIAKGSFNFVKYLSNPNDFHRENRVHYHKSYCEFFHNVTAQKRFKIFTVNFLKISIFPLLKHKVMISFFYLIPVRILTVFAE